MAIKVTNGKIPTPEPNDFLVVLPFSGTPTPVGRLPVGNYVSIPNPFRDNSASPFYQPSAAQSPISLAPYIWASFTALLQGDIPESRVTNLVADLAAITTTIAPFASVQGQTEYDLTGLVPDGYTVDYVFFAGIGLTNIPLEQWTFDYDTKVLALTFEGEVQGDQEIKIFLKKGTTSASTDTPPAPPIDTLPDI